MIQQQVTIAFIGAGNMSRALIGGLVAGGFEPQKVWAANPSTPKLDALEADFGIQVTTDNAQAARSADVVVLGVKPQKMKQVCAELLAEAPEVADKLFVSIASGITSELLSQYLGPKARIVRTMPNTPSRVGLGMTGLYAKPGVSNQEKAQAEQIMRAVGEVLWVEQESGIDGVIAAAGSAPAYFFLVLEAMQASAEKLGFAPEQARLLVQQAMLGSAQLVCDSPELELSELRRQVTSPGGNTEQAIKTLQAGGLEGLFDQAMQAAVRRSAEMAKEFG